MRIAITGGCGSIGSAVAGKLKHELVILDLHEHGIHYQMGRLKAGYIMGDVCNPGTCERAFRGCDVVLHTAARKYVPICEMNTDEATRVNLVGTRTAIAAARRMGVKKFLHMSTDKAVNPSSVMGETKLLAEKCVMEMRNAEMKMAIIRSGNVIGSQGCFFDSVSRLIEKHRKVPITSIYATRYIITLDRLAEFIADKMETMEDGRVYVPEMELVNVFHYLRGKYGKFEYEETGLRPGEKMHEELFHEWETPIHNNGEAYIKY